VTYASFSFIKSKLKKSGVEMAELTISLLEDMKLKELYELAREYKVSYYSKLTKKRIDFCNP